MAHPPYIREKARALRRERRLSVDEIAERLAVPKTTVWSWVADLPLARPRSNANQRRGTEAMQRKYSELRCEAYERGAGEFDRLCRDPNFRDFVCLYLAEGYKRDRNSVSICNSDAAVVKLAHRWIRMLSRNKIDYRAQIHADQDVTELRAFWARELGIAGESIEFIPKSNSGRLATRIWRCEYGVFTVRTGDTLLRARLEAWMDCLRAGWT